MQKPKAFSSDVLILLTMLIFGFYPLFSRGFPEISILSFIFFFQIVGTVGFFVLWIRKRPKITPRVWKLLISLAVVAVANDFAYLFAIRLTSIANAAFSHQLVSVFLLLFAPLFLKEKTEKSEWIAFFISLAGLAAIYSGSFTGGGLKDAAGITLGLLSAVFLALLIVIYRILSKENLTVGTINFWRHLLSTAIMIPIVPAAEKLSYSPEELTVLIVFGFTFALIASGVHNYAIMRSRAMHASIIGKTEPVFAGIYAFLAFGEIPNLGLLIGGALILGSSVWLAVQDGDAKHAKFPAN